MQRKILFLSLGLLILVFFFLWRKEPLLNTATKLTETSSQSTAEISPNDSSPQIQKRFATKTDQIPNQVSVVHATEEGAEEKATSEPSGPSQKNSNHFRRPTSAGRAASATNNDSDEPKKPFWSTDAEGIVGAIGESLSEISDCYSAWLAAEKMKDLAGEVKLQFTIETDPQDVTKGKITEANVINTQLKHPLLEGCILSVVKSLTFEAPAEKMVVTYPFHFIKDDE